MAERRMFSKKIIDSDAFLDMPMSAQMLYFHLAMRADDDGFINNPKRIQRMVGCSDDDMKILLAKRFIICFESGIVVIKHWRIHNYIQKDRYHSTDYSEEMALLDMKDNGAYTEKTETVYTDCIQDGYKMDTEVRLGKDSIGKDNSISTKSDADFDQFWSAYPKKVGKQAALKSFKKINVDIQTLINAIEQQKQSKQWKEDGGKYIPNPATWLNQGRWEDELEEEKPFQNPMDDPDYYYNPLIFGGG